MRAKRELLQADGFKLSVGYTSRADSDCGVLNMDDLISRKALLEKAWEADTQCGYVQVVDVGDIEDAPVVDAAPVVHGRWGEYESFPLTPSLNGCPCSVCKTHFSPSSIIVMKYCPNCGAKMDGGDDND